MLTEYWKLVLKNFRHRKLRAWLTMIGIIIGITAIVSLITLGQGLENSITGQFDKFGSRQVFIASKQVASFGPPSGAGTLTEADYNVVKKIPQLEYVAGMRSETAKIVYGNEVNYRSIYGVTVESFTQNQKNLGIELQEGNPFRSKGEVVIGYKVAKDLFDKEIRVRTKLNINGKDFRVVGIFEEQGDTSVDSAIYIPIEDVWEMFGGEKSFSALTAVVENGIDVDRASEIIAVRLERSRGDENFQVTNPKKIVEQISQVLGVVRWVLVGIAFISILVGGLGIMNSMYTSVMERTKQIGTMKAIGARNSFILGLFLFESGLMGLVGGIIGILIGIFIAKGLEVGLTFAGFNLLKITISWWVIAFSLGFSFLIGMISGFLPSYKAAHLSVVDCLRYE